MNSSFKYDIGLVIHSSNNYGNNLTNYSLKRYLTEKGYKVLLIPKKKFYSLFNNAVFDHINKDKLPTLNELCNIFLLGSDQTFAKWCVGTDYFTCLPWVDSKKYFFSYASSFGSNDIEMDEEYYCKFRLLLSRFNRISLREESSVGMVNRVFGLNAEFVLDPVFLTPSSQYRALANNEMFAGKRYVAAYLLDEDQDKINLIKKIMSIKGIEYNYVIYNASKKKHDSYDGINVIDMASVEDFLGMIDNAELLVTDSFHGTCFALIFNKPFYVTKVKDSRGLDRIEALFSLFGISNHWVQNYGNFEEYPLDYDSINERMSWYILKSSTFLDNTISEGLYYHKYNKNYLFEYVKLLEKKIIELSKVNNYLLSVAGSLASSSNSEYDLSSLYYCPEVTKYIQTLPKDAIVLSSVCGDASVNWKQVEAYYNAKLQKCESFCCIRVDETFLLDRHTSCNSFVKYTDGKNLITVSSEGYKSKDVPGRSQFTINEKNVVVNELGLNIVLLTRDCETILDVVNIHLNKNSIKINRLSGW